MLKEEFCRPRCSVDDFHTKYENMYKRDLRLSDYGVAEFFQLFDVMSDVTEVIRKAIFCFIVLI